MPTWPSGPGRQYADPTQGINPIGTARDGGRATRAHGTANESKRAERVVAAAVVARGPTTRTRDGKAPASYLGGQQTPTPRTYRVAVRQQTTPPASLLLGKN